jgi:hypothetical protein
MAIDLDTKHPWKSLSKRAVLAFGIALSGGMGCGSGIDTDIVSPATFAVTLPGYYVAPTGSDSAAGTYGAPWGTLNFAISRLQNPGDTLNVRGGLYYPSAPLMINRSGTTAAHILVRGYPGETAIVDGLSLPPPAGKDAVIGITGNYVDVQSLEVRNAPNHGIVVDRGRFVTLQGNVVHHSFLAGLAAPYPFGSISQADLVIDGNTVYDNCQLNNPVNPNGSWSAGIAINNARSVTVKNNQIFQNYCEGVWSGVVDQVTYVGNTAHDNYSVNIYFDNVTNGTMRKNFVYTMRLTPFLRDGAPADGIALANEDYRTINGPYPNDVNLLNNIRVIDNIVAGGNYGAMLYGAYGLGGGLRNSLIANNTFYGGQRWVLYIDSDLGHFNTTITGNVFQQTGGTGVSYYFANPQVGFGNNLWFGGNPGDAAGTGDLNVDPLLEAPGGSVPTGYRLKPASPAIRAGGRVLDVTDDFWGTARPAAPAGYSIGAHEPAG